MIADSARLGLAYADRLLQGISPDQFPRLPHPGGQVVETNHPAFVFGHLSLYPSRILSDLGVDASSIAPTETELELFSKDAKCLDDPEFTIYPSMTDITQRFFAAYGSAVEALERTDDAVLADENDNEGMRAKFATKGSMHAFYLGGHLMVHLGQLSAWRRAFGLGPA